MHYQRCMLALVLFVICACGQSSPTADHIHRAWVDAMHTNNRSVAADLVAPSVAGGLDNALQAMQAEQNSRVLGSLQGVPEVTAPVPAGQGVVGRSTWRFAHKTVCFDTGIARINGLWKVTRWDRRPC